MKKMIFAVCSGILLATAAVAQPVSDRAVIPLGVTLVQILRLHVINGGNIEFVFNDIGDFKGGIPPGPAHPVSPGLGNMGAALAGTRGFSPLRDFYATVVEIASSTSWDLTVGAEDATMIGTDDPANIAMALNNVGFTTGFTGLNSCCGALTQVNMGAGYLTANATPNALALYVTFGTPLLFTLGAGANGGDINDNTFTINWEAGTQQGTMNAASILNQSLPADRYVTNVFLELRGL